MIQFFKSILKFSPVVFISLILFNKLIFFHEILYYGDNFHLNAPLKSLLVDSFMKMTLPTWNPYIFLGMPYFADLNLGTLYPLNILYFLFNNTLFSLTVQVFVDVILLGLFMYLFLVNKKISYAGSLFGAIIFTFCGEIFQYINNVTILNVVVFIPLVFLIFNKFKNTKKIIYLNLLIVVQAIQLVSGHPQISYYSILFCLILFMRLSTSLKNRFFLCCYYFFLSLALSAVQLLPFLELALNSNRILNSFKYSTSGNLTTLGLITFFFPNVFGSIGDGTWWGKQLTLVGYLGVPTLIILVIGFFQTKLKETKFYLLLALGCLVLSLGIPYLNFFVPGFIFFRNPEQILIFFAFFTSTIASLYFDKLLNSKIVISKLFLYLNIIGVISLIITNILWNLENKKIFFLIKHANIRLGNKISNLSLDKFNFIIGNIIHEILVFLFISSLVLILFSFKKKISKQFLYFSIIFVASCNLIYYDSKIILTTSINNIINFDVLNIKVDPLYRIITLPIAISVPEGSLPGKDFFLREAKLNFKLLQGDNNLYTHVEQVNGYSALVPRYVGQYFNSNNITGVSLDKLDFRKLNDSSVKYIISRNKLKIYDKSVKLIYANDNEYIYENNLALPRFSFKDCEDCSLTNINYKQNKISFIVNAKKNTNIIVRDMYYPGWVFKANGSTVSRSNYDQIFSIYEIKKGNYIATYEYNQKYLEVGLFVTLVSLLFLLISMSLKKKAYWY